VDRAGRRQLEALPREHGPTAPSVEPKVSPRIADAATPRPLVRVPTPDRQEDREQQEVLRGFRGVEGG
jgi:hypothetical protein